MQHRSLKFRMTGYLTGLVCIVAALVSASAHAQNEPLLQLLAKQNHFALMRHALAPGTGDPDQFDIGDCTTQRNLDMQGRKQAQGIGELLRENGVEQADIFTSQWCRCRETAELLSLGRVRELPVLNSFFQNRGNKAEQTEGLAEWMGQQDNNHPVLLVTHQVNITALTDVYPSSGQIVIVEQTSDGELNVVGSVSTDELQ